MHRGLWILPLPANPLFRYTCQRTLLGAVWGMLEFFLLYGLAAAGAHHALSACAVAIAGAVLQGGLGVALSVLILSCRINLGPALFFVSITLAPMAVIDWPLAPVLARAINVLNPMSWVSTAYLEGFLHGQAAAWLALAPALLLLGGGLACLPALRRRHHRESFLGAPPPRQLLEIDLLPEVQTPADDPRAAPRPLLADGMGSPSWQGRLGWIERIVQRILTPRECVMAEALQARRFGWSRPWGWMMFWLGLHLLASGLIQERSLEELFSCGLPGSAPSRGLGPVLASLGFGALAFTRLLPLLCWAGVA